MLKHMKLGKFVWAQYRLATKQGACFPAALLDAVVYYSHLLSHGFGPQNVVISGDSADGNIAISLLRYLESSKVLPLPAGVITFSHWLHLSGYAEKDYDNYDSSAADILDGRFLQWGATSYIPKAGVWSEIQSYISPLHHPFTTSVPLFLHAGEAEDFCSDIKKFPAEMIEWNGNEKIRYRGTANATHDLILSYDGLGINIGIGNVPDEALHMFATAKRNTTTSEPTG